MVGTLSPAPGTVKPARAVYDSLCHWKTPAEFGNLIATKTAMTRKEEGIPMRFPTLASAALALSLGLGLALPAKADLVIQGRASQALHCSAMLFMVSEELFDAGFLSVNDRDWAQGAAILMLDYVPGTDDQKLQAMGQRFDKLMRTRSIEALMDEFDETSAWCQKNFL
jgi:hypothetical protein